MSVTTKIVKSAIKAIQDEATTMRNKQATTMRNKWLTLEAWKTIIYHYYDFDNELGFDINLLTRALKLFGSSIDSNVCLGNLTGVHLRTQYFVKYATNGTKSGTDRVRCLLLTDAKSTEPKEPTDISGWNRELEKSKAVVNKTSPLFVGIRALPSFNDRAGGALNATDLVISVLRNEMIVAPIQGAAATTTIAAAVAAAATTTPIVAGYWASPQARHLFRPRPEESVEACLQRRVDLLMCTTMIILHALACEIMKQAKHVR